MSIAQNAQLSPRQFSTSRMKIFGMAFLLLCFAKPSQSQEAIVRIAPDTIMIGQSSTLFIEVEASQGDLVILPDLTGSNYQHLEFRGMGIDTIPLEDNRISLTFRLPFTSWTPEIYSFNPLSISILHQADTLILESNPFSLTVLNVDLGDDATIYDIKPIKIMRASLGEILTYFIPIVIVLALIGWLVYRYFFRKKKPAPVSIWENVEIPAHIAAISSLEKLRSQKLWQAGRFKQYHSELTFILRMFIERRFGVTALEMTTSEVCRNLPSHLDNKETLGELKHALELADLVKFAKYQPLPVENEKSLDQAIEFVKANIKYEEIKEKENQKKVQISGKNPVEGKQEKNYDKLGWEN